MQIRVFTLPLHASDELQEDLNRFLRGHRVVSVDKRFWDVPGQASWTFCVEYLDGTREEGSKYTGKVDYKEVLNPSDFAVYSKLRDLRKRISDDEKVPPFVLFTNEQLAQMVQRRVTNLQAMDEIEGIGPSRLSKYGDPFVKLLQGESPE
jgi:superfamily II DNA helicase RecQ